MRVKISSMKKYFAWGSLVVVTGLVLSMTSCAGLKVKVETELDANAGINEVLNLFN